MIGMMFHPTRQECPHDIPIDALPVAHVALKLCTRHTHFAHGTRPAKVRVQFYTLRSKIYTPPRHQSLCSMSECIGAPVTISYFKRVSNTQKELCRSYSPQIRHKAGDECVLPSCHHNVEMPNHHRHQRVQSDSLSPPSKP